MIYKIFLMFLEHKTLKNITYVFKEVCYKINFRQEIGFIFNLLKKPFKSGMPFKGLCYFGLLVQPMTHFGYVFFLCVPRTVCACGNP